MEGGQELLKPSCVCGVSAGCGSCPDDTVPPAAMGFGGGTGLLVPQPRAERCRVPAQPAPRWRSAAHGAVSSPAVGREPGTSLAAQPSASLRASPNCTNNKKWKGISLSHALAVTRVGHGRVSTQLTAPQPRCGATAAARRGQGAAVSTGASRAAGVVYSSTSPGDRGRQVAWGHAASGELPSLAGGAPRLTAPPGGLCQCLRKEEGLEGAGGASLSPPTSSGDT